MHRAIVGRSRSFQPPPQFSARPKLVLIEGGRSEEFPIPIVQLSQIVSCLLFLHEVNSLIERNHQRRHDALAKAASLVRSQPLLQEPENDAVTGIHSVVTDEVLDEIIERTERRVDLKVYTRKGLAPRPNGRDEEFLEGPLKRFYFPKHVLRQYVRWILGYRGGIKNFLHCRVREVMERFQEQGKSCPEANHIQELEFDALRARARRWLATAVKTESETRKGYTILEAKDKDRNRVFITLHHNGRVVIGIYTEHQFTREKRYGGSRQLSNQRARVYRKNKRVSFYRS